MILYAAGRFSGAAIAKVIPSHTLLGLYGIANSIIILLIMANIEHVSWRILPLCWLFMSIMFPFIFAMSLRNLGEKTKLAASFQIMSIVGGAVGHLLRPPPRRIRRHDRLRLPLPAPAGHVGPRGVTPGAGCRRRQKVADKKDEPV